jgi:hypothetical protein
MKRGKLPSSKAFKVKRKGGFPFVVSGNRKGI